METLFTFLSAIVGAGILMISYRALKNYLLNRDDDDSGIDDTIGRAMELAESLAEKGDSSLKEFLDKKAQEERDETSEG